MKNNFMGRMRTIIRKTILKRGVDINVKYMLNVLPLLYIYRLKNLLLDTSEKRDTTVGISNHTDVMASEELSDKEISVYKKTFDVFDRNKSGKITKKELKKSMRLLGQNPTKDEIEDMIKEVDTDGSGKIDFPEFIEMMKQRRNIDPGVELLEAFKVFDRNGDGYVDADELKKTMKNMGDKLSDDEVNDMIKEADRNGDGRVDYNEFVKTMNG